MLGDFRIFATLHINIACASERSTDLFISADDSQCKAARSRGLRVEAIRVARAQPDRPEMVRRTERLERRRDPAGLLARFDCCLAPIAY